MSDRAGYYRIWREDEREDDGDDVLCTNPQDAVGLWAEDSDQQSAEYSIVGGRDVPVVHVRAPDGTVTRWRVRGEAVPHYYATQVEASGFKALP